MLSPVLSSIEERVPMQGRSNPARPISAEAGVAVVARPGAMAEEPRLPQIASVLCALGIAAVWAFASSHRYVSFCCGVGRSPVVPGQLTRDFECCAFPRGRP
jgi:hypothetical protein